MQLLTNETIRDAIKPWLTSDPELHANYAEIVKRYGHISAWNVSAVTDMSHTFHWATAFNQDISAWNVSAVTNMRWMFDSATTFNQNISAWNVSAVTDMHCMFRSARVFNQDISEWNVSAVTDMCGMFYEAIAFNQNLSKWNVSAVTDMCSMFHSATAFNRNISEWNVSAVTNMHRMFDKTLLNQILHKYKLTHPFNLPQTHAYHNWTRRKQFIPTALFNCNNAIQNKFGVQTVIEMPEMRQEIGLFV